MINQIKSQELQLETHVDYHTHQNKLRTIEQNQMHVVTLEGFVSRSHYGTCCPCLDLERERENS